MSLAALPWLLFCIGVLTVHVGFALAVREGHIDACWPYWDGCASISKVGRQGDAAHLYRFGLLPYAALLGIYWLLNQGWMRQLGLRRGADAMAACGIVSALALAVYLSVLGSHGELYQFMRRVGVMFHFIGAVAAHAMLVHMLAPSCRNAGPLRGPWRALRVLLFALLVMGALSVPAFWVMEEDDVLENALEWTGTALIQLQLLCVAELWRRSGLHLRWHVGEPEPRRDAA